jgi:hypothetical protein
MPNDVWVVVCFFTRGAATRHDEFANTFVFSSRTFADEFVRKNEYEYDVLEVLDRKIVDS